MTARLEQALAKVQALSDNEQDAIALMILERIESDKSWDDASLDYKFY